MSNMSAIVSPYGDIDKTTQRLTEDTPIVKLAYEFCTEFKVQVTALPSGDRFKVLSLDGIPLGVLYTELYNNNEPVYFFESANIVKKGRGTARSNAKTRDSNKIKTLISNLKKNKEIPTVRSLYSDFKAGIRYVFKNVSNHRQPTISISNESAIVLIEHILLDKPISHEQNESLLKQYKEYQSEMKQFESSNGNAKRFEAGARIIGICSEGNRPYYLVGEATYINNEVEIQGDLKRYDSLKNVPEFSTDVLMISTYMQSQLNNDMRNEFGLPRKDTYYADIDVATGYAGNELWVGLPKTAP